MTLAVEDIEKRVETSMTIRFAMNAAVRKLKDAETHVGPEVLKILILGKRTLTPKEYEMAGKKFGVSGLSAIEAMEHLNKSQKQYLFLRMGYDINEVD